MSKIYAQKKPHEAAGVDSTHQTAPAFSNQAMLDLLKAPEHVQAKPLSQQMNEKLSQHFGVSMNGLKVFENENLNQLGETAFAHGNEIHVAKGKFAPDTAHGQEVLMHEAAHVVQQGMGMTHGAGPESAALEAQAQSGGVMVSTATFSMPTATAAAPVQAFGGGLWKKIKGLFSKKTEPPKNPNINAPHALGDRTKLNALDSLSSAMDTAYDKAWADAQANVDAATTPEEREAALKTQRNSAESSSLVANGLRLNSTAAAIAVKEYTGTAYNGLSGDIKVYGMNTANKHGPGYFAGLEQGKTQSFTTPAFQGSGNFSFSSDISDFAGGALDVMMPYLERPEVINSIRAQHDLIKDAKMFGPDKKHGTALDAVMTNVFNRDMGVDAFGALKDGFTDETDQKGVSAANSTITKLPWIQKRLESGDLDIKDVPEHMLPLLSKYKIMRNIVKSQMNAMPTLSPNAQYFQPIRSQAERDANPAPYVETREGYKMDPSAAARYQSPKVTPASQRLAKAQKHEAAQTKLVRSARERETKQQVRTQEQNETAAWREATAQEAQAQADFAPVRQFAYDTAPELQMIDTNISAYQDKTDEQSKQILAQNLARQAELNTQFTSQYNALNTPKAMKRRQPLEKKATAASDRLRQERIRQAQEAQKAMEGNPGLTTDPFVRPKDTRKRLPLNKPSRFNETQAIEETSNEELNAIMAADAQKSREAIQQRRRRARPF